MAAGDTSIYVNREGVTETTFSLVFRGASKMVKKLFVPHGKRQSLSLQDRLKIVLDCQEELNENFFPHCDSGAPIAWATYTVGKLTIYKAWLLIHYPMKPQDWTSVGSMVKREDLLMTSTMILELSHKLECNENLKQWRWLFETYVQWHALAVTLVELCVQSSSPLKDKAWAIVDIVFDIWSQRVVDSSAGFVWLPLKKLHAKANATRVSIPLEPSMALNNDGTTSTAAQLPGAYDNQTFVEYLPQDEQTMNRDSINEHDFWSIHPNMDLDLTQTDLQISNFDVNSWDYTCSHSHDEPTMHANWAGWDGFTQDTSGFATGLSGMISNPGHSRN
jgi:hypothetical protein